MANDEIERKSIYKQTIEPMTNELMTNEPISILYTNYFILPNYFVILCCGAYLL